MSDNQKEPKVIRPSTANTLTVSYTNDPKVKVVRQSPEVSENASESEKRVRRMRRTSYQARLGRKMDAIRGKLVDNQIRLTSHPTDMLRIEAERDPATRDLISRTIKRSEIVPVILPTMKDIPIRHFLRGESDILVPSLYTIPTQEYFEVYAPVECNLTEDDLLVRILHDTTPGIEEPYVFVLQVKEVLGTFGYSSLIWKKYIVTFYDESLPKKVIDIIQESIDKRELVQY